MATTPTKFLSYAGLEELINNRLGINLGGELSTSGADISLQSKDKNLATITIPLAGTTANDGNTKLPGLFTNEQKVKLEGIATGAEVNQNAFSKVNITNNNGTTSALNIAANSKTDTINFTAGTNINISGENDVITINNGYSLPVAKHNTLGGLKPSKTYSTAASLGTAATTSAVTATVNIISTTANRYYAVEADKNGVPFVNVPWTDNKGVTRVTITQGEGITVSNSGTAITETGTRTISLNAATTGNLGGIKVSAASVSGATIEENRFGVKTTSNNVAYVEIPEITTVEIDALFA